MKTLVDADLYLVGSDSAPDTGDFDAAGDVQTAIYLKNETDEDSGETTNSVLCVYVYDDNKKDNYWQELKGVALEDNAWAHVQVLVDHSLGTPMVRVYVNNTQMTARDGNTGAWPAANTDVAQAAKKVSSVSFRGTGAVDNFVGVAIETTYDKFDFTAEVYMNDTLVEVGEDGNVSRVASGVEAGEGKTAKFESFLLSNYDYEWEATNATWALSKVVVIDQGTGAETTYNYEWNPLTFSVDSLDGDNPSIDIKTATGVYGEYQTGLFDAIPSTAGATKNGTIIRIYFENLPEEGTFSAIATTTVGGTTTSDAKKVRPSEFEGGATKTVSWEFPATKDGNILSTIQVSNGASLDYESRTATVSITLDAPLLANTTFAEATYVAGSLADGQDLRWTEENGLYTFEAYVPPVAIIVAGTTTNEYVSLRAAILAAQANDTIYLLRDDAASFTAEAPEVEIDKNLTIDGGDNTLYGVTDFSGGYHDIFISAGNVTIKNLKLSEFADTSASFQYNTYPIWTAGAYAGELTLDGVTIDKFARTAVNLGGGKVLITNCTFTADPTAYFQTGVETLNADVTVVDTTITGVNSTITGEDPDAAAVFTLNGYGEYTGNGTFTVLSGNYQGQFIVAVNPNATGSVILSNGTFVATAPSSESAFLVDGQDATIEVAGGWFDREPDAKYIAAGLAAYEDAPGTDAPWTVRAEQVTVTWVITETASNMVQVAKGSQVAAYAGEDVVNGNKTFKFWSTDGENEAAFPVTANANLTFIAVWEDAAVEPIAVTIGGDAANPLPANKEAITVDATDGFTLRFAAKQVGVTYILQSAPTVDGQFADVTVNGTAVSVTPQAVDEVVELTDPDTASTVKFFRVRVVAAE